MYDILLAKYLYRDIPASVSVIANLHGTVYTPLICTAIGKHLPTYLLGKWTEHCEKQALVQPRSWVTLWSFLVN